MEKNPFKYTLDNKRYHTLNYYNRTNFGGKIYKASLNCGFTCPNLDGSRGTGGCIFCDGGSGYFTAPQLTAVQQLNSEIARLHKKFGTDMPVIAYFQANTNTYGPLEKIRAMVEEALTLENVCGIAISTRPDCISDDVLDYLADVSRRTYLRL